MSKDYIPTAHGHFLVLNHKSREIPYQMSLLIIVNIHVKTCLLIKADWWITHSQRASNYGWICVKECIPTAQGSLLMKASIHAKSCPSNWSWPAVNKQPDGFKLLLSHGTCPLYTQVHVAMDISEQRGKVSVTSHLRLTWWGREICHKLIHHCRSCEEAHQLLPRQQTNHSDL